MHDDRFVIVTFASALGAPAQIALALDGSVIVNEYGSGSVVRIGPDGARSTLATGLPYPTGVAVTADGSVFLTTSTSAASEMFVIQPGAPVRPFACCFSYPTAMRADAFGNLFVANSGDGTISKVSADGTITTVVTGLSNSGGPHDVEVAADGTLYFTEHATGKVYRRLTDGTVELLLSGLALYGPTYLALDTGGNLYISNPADATITKRSPDGTHAVFASGFVGNGSAPAIGPHGMVFAGADTLLVVNGNEVVRIRGPFSNRAPVAHLTAPAATECDSFDGAHVLLDASSSTDPDGEPLLYSFTVGATVEVDQEGPTLLVTLPLGVSSVSVTVTDSMGLSSTVSHEVEVLDTQPPEITASLRLAQAQSTNKFVALFSAIDLCDRNPVATATVGSSVVNGEVMTLVEGAQMGVLRLESPVFQLTVIADDASGNASSKLAPANH